MPITKTPIVHKFGIISHNQRLELQERLIRQTYGKTPNQQFAATKNPLELSEGFVERFNQLTSQKEAKATEEAAYKILEKIKTKAGIRSHCEGPRVCVYEAWTDLALLTQCRGKIQEDSLDVLITTLDLAPLLVENLAALFYLAEMSMYLLSADAIRSPYLRPSEIKLLKVEQLVFTRLYYHHMVGHLERCYLFKDRLIQYLRGFWGYQEAYSPYPNALLSLRYVIQVGAAITERHEQQKVTDDEEQEGITTEKGTSSGDTTEKGTSSGVTVAKLRTNTIPKTSRAEDYERVPPGGRAHSALSHSVHDLSPTLWHALDVWRCVKYPKGRDVLSALQSLAKCGLGVALENWIDSLCAISVIGEAAKVSVEALTVFQDLARGDVPAGMQSHPKEWTEYDSPFTSPRNAETTEQPLSPERVTLTSSPLKVTRESQLCKPERGQITTSPVKGDTPASTKYGNQPLSDSPGLQGWRWEVAYSYTETLSDIVLTGYTSIIKRKALLGGRSETGSLSVRSRPPLESAGLMDMLTFHLSTGSSAAGSSDWSWRVRYGALQSLVKICYHTGGDPMKDGIRSVAWEGLLKAQAKEKDERVLEALKVGQSGTKMEDLLNRAAGYVLVTHSIASKMSSALAVVYLPSSQPRATTELSPHRKKTALTTGINRKHVTMETVKPVRTSIREEISLANKTEEKISDFTTRTNFDLMRIVEDQWRKDLQKKLEEEETERMKVVAMEKVAMEKVTTEIRETDGQGDETDNHGDRRH